MELTTAPDVAIDWNASPMIPERGEKMRLLEVEVTSPTIRERERRKMAGNKDGDQLRELRT